jgi:hypothetical protein
MTIPLRPAWLRHICAMLAAVAFVFGPNLAAAAVTADGRAVSVEAAGGCHSFGEEQKQSTLGKSCCVAGCFAVPITPAYENGGALMAPTGEVHIVSYIGIEPELDTPPPRFS